MYLRSAQAMSFQWPSSNPLGPRPLRLWFHPTLRTSIHLRLFGICSPRRSHLTSAPVLCSERASRWLLSPNSLRWQSSTLLPAWQYSCASQSTCSAGPTRRTVVGPASLAHRPVSLERKCHPSVSTPAVPLPSTWAGDHASAAKPPSTAIAAGSSTLRRLASHVLYRQCPPFLSTLKPLA